MKRRTDEKRSPSLFAFLAVGYAAFTALALLVAAGIYLGLSAYLARVAPAPDAGSFLLALEKTGDAQLPGLSAVSYLGQDYGLLILDEEGGVLVSQGEIPSVPERGDLEFIPEYASSVRILAAEIPKDARNAKYLLTRVEYTQEGELTVTGYALLGEDGTRLAGTLFSEKEGLTETQLDYLRGIDGRGRKLWRYRYTEPSGAVRQAVFWMREAGTREYRLASRTFDLMIILFLLLYAAMAGVGIYWMGRRLRRFLTPLNAAIQTLPEGKAGLLEGYRGPKEFMAMACGFLRMEERLRQSEEERLKLDAERKRLLADISHDLKTPMTVARGYAAALKDGLVLPQEREAALDIIIRKTEQAGKLLEAFHEYSKLEHPQMPVDLQPVDLCAAVREYFARRYQELEQEGFGIEADIPEEPVICRLDMALLERLLENLVNNAVAYNPPGTILSVSVRRGEKDAAVLIGDNGRGIPPDLRKRLFLPFVTGDEARSGRHGSGLGLAACLRIAKLHQGSLELSEHPSEGLATEFIFTLPLCQPTVASSGKLKKL